MTYSPFKICLFLLVILLALFSITYLSESKTIENGTVQEGIFIGDITIKYPRPKTFLQRQSVDITKVKSIDSIVENIKSLIITEQPMVVKTVEVPVIKIPDLRQIDTSKVQRISYPKERGPFIKQLRNNLTGHKSRIIHYGDSQLEGDRISAYLRNRLQGLYGGSGPGFVSVVQVYEQISNKVIPSDNWERFAYFDPTKDRFNHKKYGAYTSLSRFTPRIQENNSTILDTLSPTLATIDIGVSSKYFRRLRQFKKIGLHYGNSVSPTTIKVYNNEQLIKNDQLINDGEYHEYTINLPETPSLLKIELKSKISPDFYGITLDDDKGISLDNVAMRGASGTVFANTDATTFQRMYNQLQPKVLIFQYGGNSVPYLKDSLEVKQYSRYLKNHVFWVKRKAKDASVIFIGPADMSTSENGAMISYPLLPYLDNTLKQVFNDNGVAYWSMFEAMGGENSMPYWVDQKLAGSDYTHFSPSGTKVISELFFLALYLDLTKTP